MMHSPPMGKEKQKDKNGAKCLKVLKMLYTALGHCWLIRGLFQT